MARQVGNIVLLGSRHGCTGYAMHGRFYIRRRSSLDGERWHDDAAFEGTRAAAAVLGGASAFTARFWRAIPGEIKRLMDEGAYNRLVNAVREVHLLRAGAAPTFSVAALGGLLNGLDLSEGQFLGDEVGLLAADLRGKLYHGAGDLLHLRGAGRVGFAGMHLAAAGLLGLERCDPVVSGRKLFFQDGRVYVPSDIAPLDLSDARPVDAVRWRVHLSCVGLLAPGLKAAATSVSSDWVVFEAGAVEPLLVDVPFVADGMRFVALEVAVRRKGRWKRLGSGCKVFVLACGEGKL